MSIAHDQAQASAAIRHDWTSSEVQALFDLPFNDLLFRAHEIHRRYFDVNKVQLSTLLSIKTGACPEDCAYCPQSVRYDTGLEKESLMDVDAVKAAAARAKAAGASRFCMGAAWRSPKDRDLDAVIDMVKSVKDMGLETCVTLGMLKQQQARRLAEAGLDYYNHNLDTSPEYYEKIITTRTYQDRLDTLEHVRESGVKVCCGGIVGMGERPEDRVEMLRQLANLPEHPQSVPINSLVKVAGTPLDGLPGEQSIDPFEFVRMIAVARIMMPESYVRLSAGRQEMNDQTQALCFFAGANSIFYGEKLLTTGNPDHERDVALFQRLGIEPDRPVADAAEQPATETGCAGTGISQAASA